MTRTLRWMMLFFFVSPLTLVACGEPDTFSNDDAAMRVRYRGGQNSSSSTGSTNTGSTSNSNTTSTSSALSLEAQAALKAALLDEYKARATYDLVMATFGSSRPFSNIVGSEVQHANAILGLYSKYGLKAPADPWKSSTSGLPVFQSFRDACKGGVQAEIDNAALYDRLLKQNLPSDIRQVFTNLRDASEDNHLAAFQRCASR